MVDKAGGILFGSHYNLIFAFSAVEPVGNFLQLVFQTGYFLLILLLLLNAFVQMRHFLAANGSLFARLDSVEKRQIETEEKLNRNLLRIDEKLDINEKNFEKVFDALEAADLPKQGVFCDGQIFDSYKFVSDLIRKAKTSIVLVGKFFILPPK